MPGNDMLLNDQALQVSCNLPAGGSAGGTSATSLMDLGLGSKGQADFQRLEFKLAIPALSATQLPNSTNFSFQILTTDVATTNPASAVPMYTIPSSTSNWALASSGSPGANFYFRTPIGGVHRFIFATATSAASTLATTATLTLSAVA